MRSPFAVSLVAALFVVPVSVDAEQVPLPIAKECHVDGDARWSKQENFVWQKLCIGETANFNEQEGYGGELDPKKPEGFPERRILTPTFLEEVLLDHRYRQALTRRGVRIIGARFNERIDLESAKLAHELWLEKSILEQGANLERLKTPQQIGLWGCKVPGSEV
jgi:hypothetical protein